VQVGTPEQLVLEPATDYVAEFTRDVSKAKVVAVSSLMKPPQGAPVDSVSANTRIAEAARAFGSHPTLGVTDDTGRVIGRLDRADVADMMLRG